MVLSASGGAVCAPHTWHAPVGDEGLPSGSSDLRPITVPTANPRPVTPPFDDGKQGPFSPGIN
eukprot:6133504-Prymnesium_polylepis.1